MGFIHQTYILQRLLRMRGQTVSIYRPVKNQYGEVAGLKLIQRIRGLFHESNGYLSQSLADSGKVNMEKQPMILIPYAGSSIKREDYVEISGTQFRVTELDDLGNMHLFLDISLGVESCSIPVE